MVFFRFCSIFSSIFRDFCSFYTSSDFLYLVVVLFLLSWLKVHFVFFRAFLWCDSRTLNIFLIVSDILWLLFILYSFYDWIHLFFYLWRSPKISLFIFNFCVFERVNALKCVIALSFNCWVVKLNFCSNWYFCLFVDLLG